MPATAAIEQLRQVAATLPGLDVDCYRRHGRDPLEPVLGLGAAAASWCFFGRDPGEQEVRQQRPFVGDAGRKIRAVLAEVNLSERDIFWLNTVPYKRLRNKPWPLAVQRRCRPPLLQLLAAWHGSRVVTFGAGAFRWFGLGGSEVRAQLEQFWRREDKYRAECAVPLELADGPRTFTLCPLPHPSGANARWAKAFPDLLRARLAAQR